VSALKTSGKTTAERSHRIDAEEFDRLLDGFAIDDAEVFKNKLREWENYYNYQPLPEHQTGWSGPWWVSNAKSRRGKPRRSNWTYSPSWPCPEPRPQRCQPHPTNQRETFRDYVRRNPGPCPLSTPVTGTVEGRPWTDSIDFTQTPQLMRHVSAACFIVLAYLTGMRPGENGAELHLMQHSAGLKYA
jgi:hypothetical protein